MTDIKQKILNHFYTRKKHFILGKPVLTIFQGKDRFDITGELIDGLIRFKIEHGVAHIYFLDIDAAVDFIEKRKD